MISWTVSFPNHIRYTYIHTCTHHRYSIPHVHIPTPHVYTHTDICTRINTHTHTHIHTYTHTHTHTYTHTHTHTHTCTCTHNTTKQSLLVRPGNPLPPTPHPPLLKKKSYIYTAYQGPSHFYSQLIKG